jgi:hypothetical protein
VLSTSVKNYTQDPDGAASARVAFHYKDRLVVAHRQVRPLQDARGKRGGAEAVELLIDRDVRDVVVVRPTSRKRSENEAVASRCRSAHQSPIAIILCGHA